VRFLSVFILFITRFRWLAAGLFLLLAGRIGHAEPLPAPHAFVRQFGPADGLSQPFIYCLLQDQQGYLWLGTAEGLVRYDGARFVTLTTQDGLAENFVTGLWEEPGTGRLWVAHDKGGRSLRPALGAAFRAVAPTTAAPKGWRAPAPGPPAPDTARLRAYLRRYPLPLPADVAPSCLLEDRDGNAWLGTAGQGLWRHSDRFATLVPLSASYAAESAALAAAPAGAATTIWGAAGTRSFWLDNLLYAPASAGSSGTLTTSVRTLLARPAALGGGTWQGGPNGVWAAAASRVPATRVPGLPAGLNVAALAYSPTSGLWVGTVADGVYYLPLSPAGAAMLPAVHFTTANGLLHNQIYKLLADHTGRIWIGTHGTGFSAWEPGSRRFHHYRVHPSGLATNALVEDTQGTIWVGTEGQGLYYLEAGAHRYQSLEAGSTGLPDDYTLALVPLGEQLLLVHPQSLSLLDTRRHVSRPIRLLSRNFLPAAAALGGSHPTAWVATQAGLLRLDVSALLAWTVRAASWPSLALTGAEVDGESRLPTAIGELSAQQHRVSFAFQGLSLAAGDAPLLYQYRLHGLSTDWSRPSPAGEAQFVGLGAGHYTLEVRARYAGSDATDWSPVVSTRFSIATPWWQRGWVLALVIIAVVSSALLVVRGREGLLRRQRAQLELTVRQRTSELRANERGAARSPRRSRGLAPSQSAVSGQYEPRNSHSDERRYRPHQPAPTHAAHTRAGRVPYGHRLVVAELVGHSQRHPRLF
jgi:hypothetical protein